MHITAEQTEPLTSARKLLRVSGVCGIVAIIVFWSLTSLAIYHSLGNFNFTQNWLSDLSGMSHTGVFNVSKSIVNSLPPKYCLDLDLQYGESSGPSLQ